MVQLLAVVGLPLLTYYLYLAATVHQGALFAPTPATLAALPAPTLAAVGIIVGWLLFQALLYRLLPGPVRDGVYRLNGWRAFSLTLAVGAGAVTLGWIPPTILYDEFGALLTTAHLLVFAMCVWLWRRGQGRTLADFFLGTDLHPRVGGFDLKFFCESRPGLIGWLLIDLSCAAKQWETLGHVSTPMLLVAAFQLLYVADYFWHEEAILTTWDIRHERLGWMLGWGCLVWVPFTYSLQALYLVQHGHSLPAWAVVGLIALNGGGYAVFRGANWQKHRFRSDPAAPVWGRPAEYVETAAGARLLASGWWGLSRHMNYFGDWLMALAWSLPCGFTHLLPYFYPAYFLILLVHRERRDHAHCLAKYGDDWTRYCARVRWRIVPWVY